MHTVRLVCEHCQSSLHIPRRLYVDSIMVVVQVNSTTPSCSCNMQHYYLRYHVCTFVEGTSSRPQYHQRKCTGVSGNEQIAMHILMGRRGVEEPPGL